MTLIKWWIPKKTKGRKLAKPGWSFEPETVQAVMNAARAESAIQGKKISPSALINNLIMRSGNVFIPIRSEMSKEYTQLKRETASHETSNNQPSEAE